MTRLGLWTCDWCYCPHSLNVGNIFITGLSEDEFEDFYILSNNMSVGWCELLSCFDFVIVMCLVVVGSVLRSIVRSRVGGVTIGTVGVLLLVVDRHQVLHVHGVLLLLVGPDAHSRQAEEDGGNEGQTNSNPGDNVAPVILELSGLLQILK